MSRNWVCLSVFVAGSCSSTVPAAAAEPDAAERAAFDGILMQADERFVAGDLQGALELLEPACANSDRAECSFSLGAIEHGLGHCVEARAHYQRYRVVAPQGDHIAEVTAALEEVESRCGDSERRALTTSPELTAPAEPKAASQLAASPALTAVPELASGAAAAAPPAPATGPAHAPVADPTMMVVPETSSNTALIAGSFAVSGAAAASSVVFGVLAARSARRCDQARAYDQDYVRECEVNGPRYQGLWQGFAIASGGFLAVGVTLWWLDSRSSASLGVSGAGYPELNYRRTF